MRLLLEEYFSHSFHLQVYFHFQQDTYRHNNYSKLNLFLFNNRIKPQAAVSAVKKIEYRLVYNVNLNKNDRSS